MMKIDYVVPYVNSRDLAWQELISKYKPELKNYDKNEFNKRYAANDLFKFHFRSIEKFMPWIDTVHLLVQSNTQIPNWLNQDIVHIVKHDEFIPVNFLPTFNSGTIECFLHNIPGLNTCFIYANDDMYLMNKVEISDMFNGLMPLVNVNFGYNFTQKQQYDNMTKHMTEFILNNLKINYENGLFMRSVHGHRPFNKTIYKQIYLKFKKYIDSTCTQFRSDINTTESFFTVYYYLSTGRIYKGQNFHAKYISFDRQKSIINFFNKKEKKPQSVCINNNNGNDILIMSEMNKMFPNKSKYEK